MTSHIKNISIYCLYKENIVTIERKYHPAIQIDRKAIKLVDTKVIHKSLIMLKNILRISKNEIPALNLKIGAK